MSTKNYTWLFSPGTNCYISQLTRYCDGVAYEKDGVWHPIQYSGCKKLIGSRYNCVKFPEIDTELQEKYLLANLIAQTGSDLVHWYKKVNANGFHHLIMINRYNLGQDDDIKAVNETYQNITDENIIAYGVSRGSMALINWMAIHKPQNIRAVILEGTPSDMEDIAKNSTGYHYYYYQLIKNILPYATSFNPEGTNATKNILDLPRDIPILFITSKTDKTVPFQCSLNLFEKMKEAGFENVEICILDKAGHDDYLTNNEADTNKYLEAVKEVYVKVGLSMDDLN